MLGKEGGGGGVRGVSCMLHVIVYVCPVTHGSHHTYPWRWTVVIVGSVFSAIGGQRGSGDADGIVTGHVAPLTCCRGGVVNNSFIAVRGLHVGQLSEHCAASFVSGGPCLGTTHGVLLG